MGIMKTPGIYRVEKDACQNSLVGVATAVPAFIGYTEKAVDGTNSLLNKPKRICSMVEFHNYFGGAPVLEFKIESGEGKSEVGKEVLNIKISDAEAYHVSLPPYYNLYYNMLLFYVNGGGVCYVVSVGGYDAVKAPEFKALEEGIQSLLIEQEPTILVIPEAVNLPQKECYALQQAMLSHCGGMMKNRIAVLDVWNGISMANGSITTFREGIGGKYLDFGTVYFPWLRTSVVLNLSHENIMGWDDWMKNAAEKMETSDSLQASLKALILDFITERDKLVEEKGKGGELKMRERTVEEKNALRDCLHATLIKHWPKYRILIEAIRDRLNLLPPSAAMAGIYTMVDNTRGVWKAPANISLSSVVMPAMNISHDEQEDLNVPMNGKAINAIRSFIGEGIKVWGARTLDANSLDWRYINVRRTMIYLEESIKNGIRAYVFEPNVANTWSNVKSMIENFLREVWKRGGLAGASPDDAYCVHVGLGDTMTPEDILEGILRVRVLVAISRPAEFLEITFQQKMQKN